MVPTAALFDKDGTLVDFHLTWDAAIGEAIAAATATQPAAASLAAALGYDRAGRTVSAGSPLVAESNQTVLDLVAAHGDPAVFEQSVMDASERAVTAAPGVDETVRTLRAAGVATAVVTNDFEATTRRQLDRLGWGGLFDAVLGADSGFGPKPGPGMIDAALSQLGVDAAGAVMVGDSRHDLLAGRAARVATVLVTNGEPADQDLLGLADQVIDHMDELVALFTPT